MVYDLRPFTKRNNKDNENEFKFGQNLRRGEYVVPGVKTEPQEKSIRVHYQMGKQMRKDMKKTEAHRRDEQRVKRAEAAKEAYAKQQLEKYHE